MDPREVQQEAGDFVRRDAKFLFTYYSWGDYFKKDEIYGPLRRVEKYVQHFN